LSFRNWSSASAVRLCWWRSGLGKQRLPRLKVARGRSRHAPIPEARAV
jgi:hypothetical protein